MTNTFKERVDAIALKYADIVEKQVDAAIQQEDPLSRETVHDVNEGIRMLNHVASTMERIYRLETASVFTDGK